MRQFDWQAWYDGEEDEQMACGHGATEQAAIEDLVMNYPRWRIETMSEREEQAAIMLTTIPSSKRERLRQIIAERSFSQGKTFRLASGKESNFYFDLKPTMLDPEGIDLLADLILERTANIEAEYVGGLAMGAVPVAVAAILKSHGTSRPLKGFWVRKEAKGHGTNNLTDGYLPDGANVIIVDDVTTTGGSVLQAIDEVRRHNCKIAAVITIVDRLEGAKEKLASRDVELIALFNTKDFAS